MSTKGTVAFTTHDGTLEAAVYVHNAGSFTPETFAEFFAMVARECGPEPHSMRFHDPSYLAAKFVVWCACTASMRFQGVGVITSPERMHAHRRFTVRCHAEESAEHPEVTEEPRGTGNRTADSALVSAGELAAITLTLERMQKALADVGALVDAEVAKAVAAERARILAGIRGAKFTLFRQGTGTGQTLDMTVVPLDALLALLGPEPDGEATADPGESDGTAGATEAPDGDCRGFQWIGQSFASCDGCGKPAWEHEGMAQLREGVPLRLDGGTDDWEVRPWAPGEADAIRRKWGTS